MTDSLFEADPAAERSPVAALRIELRRHEPVLDLETNGNGACAGGHGHLDPPDFVAIESTLDRPVAAPDLHPIRAGSVAQVQGQRRYWMVHSDDDLRSAGAH